MFLRSTAAFRVGPPRVLRDGGRVRIEAEVDGAPAWFESDQIELTPAPEAFPSAFLIPALHRRARLEIETAVDPTWRAQLDPLLGILRGWWRLPRLLPRDGGDATRWAGTRTAPRTALFFSGGVDSFHALLRDGSRPDLLVLVHGFDYPLSDVTRHEAAERTLRDVSQRTGTAWAVIRTNVRQHAAVEHVPWERTHGGILAAAAHLLPDDVGEVRIASSIARNRDQPWGSHWRLDPLWSSTRRTIAGSGDALRHSQKLVAMVDEPLLQEHLRVCWENRTPAGNCSRCYKCVLTRLMLANVGALSRFRTLEGPEHLAAHVDGVPRGKDRVRQLTDLTHSTTLDPEVVAAVRRLVARTRWRNSPAYRWRRALVSTVMRWTQPART